MSSTTLGPSERGAAGCFLAAVGSDTSAQNLEPRTYANTPIGLNFLIAGYSYAIQGHGIYSLRSGIWVAVDSTYYAGGRITIDGVESNDLQNNWRVILTVALPVTRHNSPKLYANTDVDTRTSGDFDIVGITWQYCWGGGL